MNPQHTDCSSWEPHCDSSRWGRETMKTTKPFPWTLCKQPLQNSGGAIEGMLQGANLRYSCYSFSTFKMYLKWKKAKGDCCVVSPLAVISVLLLHDKGNSSQWEFSKSSLWEKENCAVRICEDWGRRKDYILLLTQGRLIGDLEKNVRSLWRLIGRAVMKVLKEKLVLKLKLHFL